MLIKAKKIRFTPSVSADVVSHNIRIVKEGSEMNHLVPAVNIPMPGNEYVINLADFFSEGIDEGVFIIGVSSVDDVGNESDIATVVCPLDITAPMAPSNLEILDL